jgi:hypothetical protein
VTEQLERELTQMFHERAQSLDVLPPLPAERVRRARMQSALAMASVVAVLAAAGTVGVRLASGTAGGDTSIASSGSAQEALERVAEHMLTGRWRVTGTESVVQSGRAVPMGVALQVDYDGPTKSAVARNNGKIVAIQVDGVTYVPLEAEPDVMAYLPKGAQWQQTPFPMFGTDPAAFVTGASNGASTTSGPHGSPLGPGTADAMRGATVHRTAAGFRIDTAEPYGGWARTEVKLRADGTISSVHTVTQAHIPNAMGTSTTDQRAVLDVVFTPLSTPVDVVAPDPATVVSNAEFSAAFQKAFAQGAPGSKPCPSSMTTPSPAIVHHHTSPGGSVTTTQSTTMLTCRMATLTLVTPSASPSPH